MAKDPLEKRSLLINQGGPEAVAIRKKLAQTFRKLGLKP
jgi:hypothetical protein